MMGTHVFVSYAREDHAYVGRLLMHLRAHGVEVWSDETINAGAEWPKVIQESIDGCAVFVVVMSSAARASDWVLREVLRALARRKLIFPLLLTGESFFEVSHLNYESVEDAVLPSPRWLDHLKTVTGATVKSEPHVAYARRETSVPDYSELRHELESIKTERDRLRGTLAHMGEYYTAVYRDSLELTYYIGSTGDEDHVTEKRSTLPQPTLPFIVLRPTVPPRDRRVPFEEIDFGIDLDFGEIGVVQHVLLEDSPKPIKYVICFTPSVSERLGWTIRYRMPGLWNELRGSDRRDSLAWKVVDRREGRGVATNLVHFTVNFLFPRGIRNPSVSQADDQGSLTEPIEISGDLTLIRWDCPQPAPVTYRWNLENNG
jgi:hypothetical protein